MLLTILGASAHGRSSPWDVLDGGVADPSQLHPMDAPAGVWRAPQEADVTAQFRASYAV